MQYRGYEIHDRNKIYKFKKMRHVLNTKLYKIPKQEKLDTKTCMENFSLWKLF